eukprot:CAMPEP_0204823252 /NCGR_PEP_ID=MMETSP1346-20131115/1329_1 /ASSEMBLY_ACC=CAM_ASM_000771 /TAXON_ID=215587 /ORGANISM="Aplanochytrium stocchinoi, Strain GSBS06" /LENGTH=384 /DNA_ID=CAMNT_0051949819 /DNA_START=221 /DNA_END=1372 /DNA_ORIENTATION=+
MVVSVSETDPSWLFGKGKETLKDSKQNVPPNNQRVHVCVILTIILLFSTNIHRSKDVDAYASSVGHITAVSRQQPEVQQEQLDIEVETDSIYEDRTSNIEEVKEKQLVFQEDPYSIEPEKKSKVIPVSVIDEYELRKNLSMETLQLVQTVPELTYNLIPSDSGRKYFMFTPSGGFNNQRICLEYALRIGKILNRAVIAPMAGKHLNFWYRYFNQTYDTLVPMDTLLDFEYLQSYGTDLIPLNITLKELEKQLNKEGRIETIYKKYRANWKEHDIPRQLASDAQVLFLKGHTMYHKWFDQEIIDETRSYVVYSKLIRRTAFEIMKSLGGKYNAVHIRLGDYMKAPAKGTERGFKTPDPENIVKDLISKKKFSIDEPLYIATEPEW